MKACFYLGRVTEFQAPQQRLFSHPLRIHVPLRGVGEFFVGRNERGYVYSPHFFVNNSQIIRTIEEYGRNIIRHRLLEVFVEVNPLSVIGFGAQLFKNFIHVRIRIEREVQPRIFCLLRVPERVGVRLVRLPALSEKKSFVFARAEKILLNISDAFRINIDFRANRFPLVL